MNPGNDQPISTPPQLTTTASKESLPEMNSVAEKSTQSSSQGVAKCKLAKHWFGLMLLLTDDKGKTTPLANAKVKLKIPDLGEVEKLAPGTSKPILVGQLAPGGKGDILKIEHDTDVFEAAGDFY